MKPMHRRFLMAGLVPLIALAACREADRPVGPDEGGTIFVDSDPPGAAILLDGESTGLRTPDTLRQVKVGLRNLVVRLDSAGLPYGYGVRIESRRGEVRDVWGSLVLRCTAEPCFRSRVQYHAPNRVRFGVSPTGSIMYVNGAGEGLYWPAETGNSYVSAAAAVFAGQVNYGSGSQPVSLGVYSARDVFGQVVYEYYAGRPAPEVTQTAGRFTLRQPVWVLPPVDLQVYVTVRGLEIEQEFIARSDVDDVVLIRLTYRNISAEDNYRVMDPYVPETGVTFENAYIGLALDADIGNSDDDLLSYVPDLDLAFMYDSDFRESGFGAWSSRPGLIGVRMLESPPGTQVYLNGWWREADWFAGVETESIGHVWLRGDTPSGVPKHSARIGYAPTEPRDYRVSVMAGPLRLAPGESASVTVAVMLAEPAAGWFTSGAVVEPGDPFDANRRLLRIAEPLVQRAVAAEALLGSS